VRSGLLLATVPVRRQQGLPAAHPPPLSSLLVATALDPGIEPSRLAGAVYELRTSPALSDGSADRANTQISVTVLDFCVSAISA